MNLNALIKRAHNRVQIDGWRGTAHLAWSMGTGLVDYYLNPFSLRTSKLSLHNWQQIRQEMESAGLKVESYIVDIPAFRTWLERVHFPEYYRTQYKQVFIEKALEHFVSADLLGLSPGTLFVDVAASNSPWVEIAPRLYGVTALAVDLIPPNALEPGHKITCDATMLPLRHNQVDSMALHCAYEMFEGDSDSRLITEASRVLRPGGRLVILPLYMHHLYYADSSILVDRRGVDYQGAVRVWRESQFSVRFCRNYDVPALMERVIKHKGDLQITIRYIENETEVDPICYLKFAAVFEKPRQK